MCDFNLHCSHYGSSGLVILCSNMCGDNPPSHPNSWSYSATPFMLFNTWRGSRAMHLPSTPTLHLCGKTILWVHRQQPDNQTAETSFLLILQTQTPLSPGNAASQWNKESVWVWAHLLLLHSWIMDVAGIIGMEFLPWSYQRPEAYTHTHYFWDFRTFFL